MLVTATKRGFDGVKVREVGETFEFAGKTLGSWMVEAKADKPAAKAKQESAKPAEPQGKASDQNVI